MHASYLRGVTTLTLDASLCNGCAICTEVCPHGVLMIQSRRAIIVDADACMECGACARNCRRGALQVDAGVGCAAAFISTALGRKGACCGESC